MQRYGVPSGETLDDSLLVAVIVMSRHSLPELRAALRSHFKTIGRDCQKLRTFVNDFLTSGLEYTSAAVLSETSVTSANNVPVTMDVGGEQETKEAPRLEPKVFELSSEVTEQRCRAIDDRTFDSTGADAPCESRVDARCDPASKHVHLGFGSQDTRRG